MRDDQAPVAEDPVRADEADAGPQADDGADGSGEDSRDDSGDDTFDLELDGQVHTLPAALKGAFLRQADYTRKTQELAAHRRALEAASQAVAAHAQAAGQASDERVHLAALDQQLAQFHDVDWQGLAEQDPRTAQALWDRAQAMAHAREGLARTIGHRAAHGRLQAAHAAAARMAETGRVLQKEIDGWSPELAAKLVDYARGHGVTLEELSGQDDPRVWKILHRASQADAATQKEGVAKSAAQAQAVRPAVLVSGSAAGGGGVRDELATKEWMKRRNDLVRKGRG